MSYYHYTKGSHLAQIVNEGIIRTSRILIKNNGKPAAWLTTSPEWEPACNIIGQLVKAGELVSGQTYSSDEVEIVLCHKDYMKKEIGMCRIILSENISATTWAKFKHVSGFSEETYQVIDDIGSPVNKWYCKFNDIPSKYWEGIEMYVDGKWVRWDEKLPIQEFVDLCLSCNGKKDEEVLVPASTTNHVRIQLDFIENHYEEIIELWEINKHKNGNVVFLVPSNYGSYESGFMESEKPIQKSAFKILQKSETENFAYVQFDWGATSTQCYLALAY